ncbi:hypothetical protein FRC19_007417 [Serendipita sp. 401]|nr:hypothetical protein FRC19_007417 [Serendipita sp. 401]KAG9049463.1 hypothetical protein FS842_011528 [Serendipita sp. 407]
MRTIAFGILATVFVSLAFLGSAAPLPDSFTHPTDLATVGTASPLSSTLTVVTGPGHQIEQEKTNLVVLEQQSGANVPPKSLQRRQLRFLDRFRSEKSLAERQKKKQKEAECHIHEANKSGFLANQARNRQGSFGKHANSLEADDTLGRYDSLRASEKYGKEAQGLEKTRDKHVDKANSLIADYNLDRNAKGLQTNYSDLPAYHLEGCP